MKFANNSANSNGLASSLVAYDGPCVFFSLHVGVVPSSVYIQLFDARTLPRTGDRPKRVWSITEFNSFDHETTNGIPMQNGCVLAMSSTPFGYTAAAIEPILDVVFYIPPPPAPPKTDPLPEDPALKPSPAPQRPPPASTPAGRPAPTSKPLKASVAALLAFLMVCASSWAASSTTPGGTGATTTRVAAGTNVIVVTNGTTYTISAQPGVGGSATNAQPQSSILTNLATVGISTTNLLWVSKAGNDATAARCRLDLPFATPSAAKLAALSGDTAVVLPGFHVATNSLTKSNVNWWVMAGGTLALTNQFIITNSGTARALFDDLDGPATFTVDGDGDFIYDAGVPPFDDATDDPVPSNLSIKGLVYIQNSNSVVSFKGRRAMVRSYAVNPVLPSAFWINDGDVNITVEEIIDLGMGTTVQIGQDEFEDPVLVNPNVSALYWALGETHITAGTIRVSAYPIYASHPPGSGHIANLWARLGNVTNSVGSGIYIYGSGTSAAWKTWIDVFAFENNSTTAYSLNAGGSHYLKAMKLQSARGLDLNFLDGGVTRGWFDIQKLAVSTSAISVSSTNALSHFDISVDHIEEIGGTLNPAIQFAGGAETWVRSGRVLLNNGNCVLHTGGRAHLEGFTLDSSSSTNPAVMVRTNGLTLNNCTLITTNTQFSIATDIDATTTVQGYNTVLTTPTNKVNFLQPATFSKITQPQITLPANLVFDGGVQNQRTNAMAGTIAILLSNLTADVDYVLEVDSTGSTAANLVVNWTGFASPGAALTNGLTTYLIQKRGVFTNITRIVADTILVAGSGVTITEGPQGTKTFAAAGGGVTAGTNFGDVLATDGSATFWEQDSSLIRLDEEFWAVNTVVPYAWEKSGFTMNSSIQHGDANHWGVLRARSTTLGVFSVSCGLETIQFGAGTCAWSWIVKMDNVPAQTTNNAFTQLVGLGDIAGTLAQTDGVYFRGGTNSLNWEAVTESNTTETSTDTGIAIATGWVRFSCKIVNATSAVFYINGAPVATHTTNIPNGVTRDTGILYLMERTSGTAERNHYLDAFHLAFKPTTPR